MGGTLRSPLTACCEDGCSQPWQVASGPDIGGHAGEAEIKVRDGKGTFVLKTCFLRKA